MFESFKRTNPGDTLAPNTLFPAQFAHRMVAGVAIKQTSSGNNPSRPRLSSTMMSMVWPRPAPAWWPRPARRPRLSCARSSPCRPQNALGAISVNVSSSKLMRGWPAPHDTVRDQTIAVCRSGRKAKLGARDRIVERIKAVFDVRLMVHHRIAHRAHVRGNVLFRRPVAGFAGDAVCKHKALAAFGFRNVCARGNRGRSWRCARLL